MAKLADYFDAQPDSRSVNIYGERVIRFPDQRCIAYSNKGARLLELRGPDSVEVDYYPAVLIKTQLATLWRKARA